MTSRIFELFGVKVGAGRVWTLLALSPEPMNAVQIQNALNLSTGSVSHYLNILQNLETVYRKKPPDERVRFYSAESNLLVILTRVYQHKARNHLDFIMKNLASLDAELAEHNMTHTGDKSSRYQRQQLRRLIKWIGFLIALFDTLAEYEAAAINVHRKRLSVTKTVGEICQRIGRLNR